MTDHDGGAARRRLGSMVRGLMERTGLGLRPTIRKCAEHHLTLGTLRNWQAGTTAPAATEESETTFWGLISTLQAMLEHPPHSNAEWEAALRAAQHEAVEEKRARQEFSPRQDPSNSFVRAHLPVLRPRGGLVGRKAERDALHAFVRAEDADDPWAAGYLCWEAALPVGKTALLADYVKRPSPDVDVLNFFVSAARGTHHRAAFSAELGRQARAFLHRNAKSVPDPGTPEAFAELLTLAAAKAAGRGRRLLLVVDGLDEDAAWSAPAGSIAALLPVRPVANLRVVLSLRAAAPLPAELPAEHPLRRQECLRALGAGSPERAVRIEREAAARADRLRSDDRGRRVVELLAVAGGGLRVPELAELTGVDAPHIEGLLRGADGRCLVLGDPGLGSYGLSHDGIAESVRRAIGPTEVGRQAALLHAWADRWRAAGWPEGTPRYLLVEYLRLLPEGDRRTGYVLDPGRQLRLAATAGFDLALAQLDLLSATFDPADDSPAGLALAARHAVSRTLLLARAPHVPLAAPALLARLGDMDRALALARSAPAPVARAARLAHIAVELARHGLPRASQVAEEAAGCVDGSGWTRPRSAAETDALAEVAEAARLLLDENATEAARALLRCVVVSGSADVETLIAAVHLLGDSDKRVAKAVRDRIDALSAGDLRARVDAVDILAVIVARCPALGPKASDAIATICAELEPSDGLLAVDILALGASALAKRRWKAASGLARAALERLSGALAAPAELSPEDQAHLRRELAATLARVVRAVADVELNPRTLDELRELLTPHREEWRVGLLDDDLAERAEAGIAAGAERLGVEAATRDEAEWEQRQARRRVKDAESRALARQRKKLPPVVPRSRKRPPAPRTASPAPAEDGQPAHLRLVARAERRLRHGDPPRCRALLEAALRHVPVSAVDAGEDWAPALVQALGAAGEAAEATRLVSGHLEAPVRARLLAALSLGCALGGRDAAAASHAQEAARLATGVPDPVLRGVVAQALAHAGDATAAVRLARHRDPGDGVPTSQLRGQIRQSLTAVAAGLARRAPEAAAQVVDPLLTQLSLRVGTGSPVNPLPRLAALVLAVPDRPESGSMSGSELREVLRHATGFVTEPPQQRPVPAALVLALLGRFEAYPELSPGADLMSDWLRTLDPARVPHAALAVLRAVEGETAEALRVVEAAPTRAERATARAAVASQLAGVPVTLAADPDADDALVRLCLALACAAGASAAPDEATARSLTRRLLADDEWRRAIPLLPRLAPDALAPLGEATRAFHTPLTTDPPTSVSPPVS
ncbi:hypothetical protein RM844_10515 [Streptomyces sp. DSM 44915]|uniref:Uncharacterized protein n=1 Tax=Streptomyces chisholmiae TaxID=3075540 RepID=A0ABU2JP07_9ACTN|nr:hypothetical protein [Streptomyces sp. DSM 44915]MDT0266726.1 hypothetical protein [Streptomyces sp. DSM 44915]